MPAADWYEDPSDGTRLRYWDGEKWTAQVRDKPPPPEPRVEGTTTAAPPPPSPPPKWKRWWPVAILVVIILAGIAVATGGDDKRTITGTFVLTDASNIIGSDLECHGDGGYDDFRSGMDVTIRNGAGDIVASTAALSAALYSLTEQDQSLDELLEEANDGWAKSCPLFWSAEVPAGEAFYEIEIGRRGEISYSKADLEATDWHVSHTLG